ncbi:MAG: L-threonylcarbamoyladenylate synthase, partial [Acidimicrobiia bacterium]|nr:L-threonylcarbamoyladenylate synthase [Acidimicrobiia bacterium]
ADATSAEAVTRIFAAKGRPADHPLIVHIGSRDDLERFGADVPPEAARLVDAFWPGPLTLIVGRGSEIVPETTGGRDTVGLRMPDHSVALELLDAFAAIGSGAVAAPSANRFGGVSPTTAAHVAADLGTEVELILDGGPCRVGVESTIVELTGPEPVLLRPGGISAVELEAVLGRTVLDGRGGRSRASGMLESHYAPDAEVILLDGEKPAPVDLGPDDGLISAGARPAGAPPVDGRRHWSLPGEAAGYAAGLYATLRAADAAGVTRLYVVVPSRGELLGAVMDRLAKAAVERP